MDKNGKKMMSGYLRAWLCALVALLGILPAKAYDFRVDGIYYELKGEEVTVVSGDVDYSGDVVIPSTVSYDGKVYSVTSIDSEAFSWCTEITSVSIPHSVTSVGKGPFFYCSNLEEIMVSADNPVYSSLDGVLYNKDKTELLKCPDKKMSVTIPNSVTTIGDTAFSDCIGLTSLTIPNSVTSVGIYAFYDCNNLTSVTIPESVTKIMDGTFSSCRSLTSVVIPNSITSIGDLAFSDCGLTSVTIPESVMSIGNLAFYFCNDLTSVVIGNSVTSIGKRAFCYCYGLTSVVIGNSVTSIGDEAFEDCHDLISVTIPNSVTSIGCRAFSGCVGLTSMVIGNSVTSIGDEAFSRCQGLTSVMIPNSVMSIGEKAFECPSLEEIVVSADNPVYSSLEGILYNKDKTELLDCPSKKISVLISSMVTSIGEKAFVGCPWLEEIIVSADNPAYTSLDGVLYNKDKTELLKWPSRKLNVTIPNSVEVIGNYAFSSCQDLTSVEIPNSVMSIGDGAFSYCQDLTSVEIPNSVTSIGDVAFSWCTQLTLVTIGESLTSIGDGAFSEYTNLQKMVVHAINPPQISSNTFSDYDMPLYVPAGSKKDYQEALYWENFTHIRETADPLYTIAVNSGDESKGRVTGGGRYREGTTVSLSAEPVGEYEFVQWSDGHTENPRRITVTEDLSLTAEFSLPSSKLSVNANDDAKGRVVALLTAAPQDKNRFVQWNDGDVKNPRTVYVTGPTNIVAEFNDSDKSVGAATGGVPHLRIEGRTLHVESGGVDYRVYTATGRQVYVGNRSTLLLSEGGTYQVHIGDYKQEIVVK